MQIKSIIVGVLISLLSFGAIKVTPLVYHTTVLVYKSGSIDSIDSFFKDVIQKIDAKK